MNVLDPLATAGTRTAGTLFSPFDVAKWFLLGFSAWLAGFLTGSNPGFGIGNFGSPTSSSNTGMPTMPDWDVTTIVVVVCGALIVFALVVTVLLWLGCRGWFMLIDNVVNGRAEIKEPWRVFKQQANSLFGFFLSLSTVMILGLLLLASPGYFLWPRGAGAHEWHGYIPVILLFCVVMIYVMVVAFVSFFTLEFGSLWMYRHGGSAWDAMWKVGQLASENPLTFIAYAVIRIVMTFAVAICGVILGCLTCCLGFIPYLGAVLNLPFSVYRVWYSIECFAQLGAECDVRRPVFPPITLPPTGY